MVDGELSQHASVFLGRPVSSPCELPKIENGLRVWTRGNSLNS